MTRIAPAIGSIAAVPGNGVDFEYRKAAARIIAMPSHETAARTAGRALETTRRESSPPAPNSHTRVGVMKKAHAGELAVAMIAQARLTRVRRRSMIAIALRLRRSELRRANAIAITITTGQKM